MKTIVIYNSKTGFTQKYAKLISEELNCQCVEFKKAKKLYLSEYEAIVFGSWTMAGTISNLDWFKKKLNLLASQGKKLIVYSVGANPADSPEIKESIPKNFTEEQLKVIKYFYCPGGINYEKMKGFGKVILKALARSLKNKKDATPEELEKAEMISKSFDLSDKKYIEPIIAEIKA